jgi:hypothetical protein
MNLSLSTQFPKHLEKPLTSTETLFVPKILKGLQQHQLITDVDAKHYLMQYVFLQRKLKKQYKIDVDAPKLHTFRHDANNRWKTGKLIHFYIYTRTKNQLLFAPVLKCVSTQKIEIVHQDPDGFKLAAPQVYVNNRWIIGKPLEQLIKNDGFASPAHFFAYFNTCFTGKIIHWTNLKY